MFRRQAETGCEVFLLKTTDENLQLLRCELDQFGVFSASVSVSFFFLAIVPHSCASLCVTQTATP